VINRWCDDLSHVISFITDFGTPEHAVLHRLQFCERVFYRHVGCKRWAHPTFPTMITIYYLRVDKPPLYFQHFKIFITANVSVTNHLSMFQWLTISNFFNFIFVLSHEKLTQRLCSASCSWFFSIFTYNNLNSRFVHFQ